MLTFEFIIVIPFAWSAPVNPYSFPPHDPPLQHMKTAANVDALTMLPVAVLRSPSPARCRPNTKTFHVNLRLQASRFARDEPAAKFGVLGTSYLSSRAGLEQDHLSGENSATAVLFHPRFGERASLSLLIYCPCSNFPPAPCESGTVLS